MVKILERTETTGDGVLLPTPRLALYRKRPVGKARNVIAGCGFVYDERSAMRDRFHWARLLVFVNQELLLRNEYLAAKNLILRAHLSSRFRLSDPERSALAEICQTTRPQSPEGYRERCQDGLWVYGQR